MKIVIAVSGGVDSIVLLDALVRRRLSELTSYQLPTTNYQLIVAHFDHGIRTDSASDEAFVREVAGKYNVPYESKRLELGEGASEELARKERYSFLRQICKKYDALLVTAHHQGDLLETMAINLIRGTGWRGLAPMSQFSIFNFQFSFNSQSPISNDSAAENATNDSRPTIHSPSPRLRMAGNQQILRPLINTPKSAILAYAKKYGVEWQEDSTNQDQTYLRNYIRHTLIPKMLQKDSKAHERLLKINQTTTQLQKEIATELQKFLPTYHPSSTTHHLQRYALIMFPTSVAQELIYAVLTNLDSDWHPSAEQITRAHHFIRTARPGKVLIVSKQLSVTVSTDQARFIKA